MTTEEVQRRIREDRDFVYLKRYDYSLKKLMERYPEGVPDRIIANALMVSEEDVVAIYDDVVAQLRERVAGTNGV